MQTPSGTLVLVPSHAAAGPRCSRGHARYFNDLVLPFCQADPIRRAGRCRMRPLAVGDRAANAASYELDLFSGVLTVGAPSAPGVAAAT
jgi:hypothetical protein